ncbi:hypothetical protein [Rubripirellula lacrimiformis]|uniref:hypothetical protein n=1 Tax=Rubripirellula lacrimiformis TaxID=1930273 RepID=UPI00119EBF0F|nr:hypothetical protein [Rubripirellula lacrimiformis]
MNRTIPEVQHPKTEFKPALARTLLLLAGVCCAMRGVPPCMAASPTDDPALESAATGEPAVDPQSPQAKAQIDETIRALGAPKISIRMEAVRQLRRIGRPATQAVADAADRHPDAEVRRLAQEIHLDFRFGLFRDTPAIVRQAIADVRSRSEVRWARGVDTLLNFQHFETLLIAIEFQPDTSSRIKMAGMVIQHPAGQTYFMTESSLTSLFKAVRGDTPNPIVQISSLFSPSIIDAIARNGKLDLLIELFADLPVLDRQNGWLLISRSHSALANLFETGGVEKVFSLIQRGTSKQAREEIAASVSGNAIIFVTLIRSGSLPRFLDFFSDSQTRIIALLSADATLRAILSNLSNDQIIELYERIDSDAPKVATISALHQLRQRMGGNEKEALRADDAIAAVEEHFLRVETDAFRVAYLVNQVRLTSSSRSDDVVKFQSVLDQLIRLDNPLDAEQCAVLTRSRVVARLLANQPAYAWFNKQIERLDLTNHALVVRQWINQRDVLVALFESEGALGLQVLDQILSKDSDAHRQLAAGIIRSISSRDSRQMERISNALMQRLETVTHVDTRQAMIASLAGNSMIIRHLIANENLEPLLVQIESIEDIRQRSECLTPLYSHTGIAQALIDLERTDLLLAYRDDAWPADKRIQLLMRIVQSTDCLSALIQQGEFEALDKATRDLANDTQRRLSRSHFLASPSVMAIYLKNGSIDQVKAFLESVPPAELDITLIMFAGRNYDRDAYSVIGETLWDRVAEIPTDRTHQRSYVLNRLLRSDSFVAWLVTQKKSGQLINRLESLLEPHDVGSVMSEFMSNQRSIAWLRSVPIDQWIQMLRAKIPTSEPGNYAAILRSKTLIDHLLGEDRFDDFAKELFAVLDQPSGNRDEWIRRMFNDSLMRELIQQGHQESLLGMLTVKSDQIPYQTFSQLLRMKEFSNSYLHDHSATEMMDLAERQQDPNAATYLQRSLLTSASWMAALTKEAAIDPLRHRLLAAPATVDRDSLLAVLITQAGILSDMKDADVDQIFELLVQRSDVSTTALSSTLRSPSTVSRLISLGHFDLMRQLAKDQNIESFYEHPRVFRRLDAPERQEAFDQLEQRLQDPNRGGFLPFRSHLVAAYIENKGIASLIQAIHSRYRDERVYRIWMDDVALIPVLKRGELLTLWEATNPAKRGIVRANLPIRRRALLSALDSAAAATALIDWLEELSPRETQSMLMTLRSPIPFKLHQHGLGERFAKLTDRITDTRQASAIQRSSSLSTNDSVSLLIQQSKIDLAIAKLRSEANTPPSNVQFVSLLMTCGLAESELAAIQAADSNASPAGNADDPPWTIRQQRKALLLRAMDQPTAAIESAVSNEMPDLASSIAIEQHDWATAAKHGPPMTKKLLDPPSNLDANMDAIESAALSGKIGLYADDMAAYNQSIEDLKQIVEDRPDDLKSRSYAAEMLIASQRVQDGIARLGRFPWQAFYLRRATGFYDPAFAACNWNGRPAAEYFDAAASQAAIGEASRQRTVPFLLDIAETERMLGRSQTYAEIQNALRQFPDRYNDAVIEEEKEAANPSDPTGRRIKHYDKLSTKVQMYRARLFGEWIRRGELEECRRFEEQHPQFDQIVLANETFRKLGPDSGSAHHLNSLIQTSTPLLPVTDRLDLVMRLIVDAKSRDPAATSWSKELWPLQPNLHPDAPEPLSADHPLWADVVAMANAQMQQAADRQDGRSSSIFETMIKLWAPTGVSYPMDPETAKTLIDNTDDADVLCWYGIGKLREGDAAEAVRIFAAARRMSPARADIVHWHADALQTAAQQTPAQQTPAQQTPAQQNVAAETALIAQRLLHIPDDRFRVAHGMMSLGQRAAAIEQLKIIRKTTAPGSRWHVRATEKLADWTLNHHDRFQYSRELLIAACRQRSDRTDRVRLLEKTAAVHHACMDLALAQKDWETLRRQWTWSRQVNANDAAPMTKFIPRVREAGNPELADEMFAASDRFLGSRIDKFTESDAVKIARRKLRDACAANESDAEPVTEKAEPALAH